MTAPSTSSHPLLRIGEAARQSGVSPANIRHYERAGLLPPAARQDNHYRGYSAEDIHLLRLIRLCRSLDMSLEEIREIMALDSQRPADCQQATHTIASHLAHVQQRIAELRQLEQRLQALLAACNGQQQTCRIIEALHTQADRLDTHASAAPSARPRHV
ncbi:MerR family transcriptional regulator [Corticibacter populi]|uniref:MerR family transcriptional regulator n=1 Tax=Corticibacter populi TaxID=1550736 RepID=A0A3M6R0S4_9BURK|nr:MerR family transcriptional regulator [Corticibacter populi]RMX08773.1 MerR family transcriptional regulator [Corticibacter populi]RZS36132.1 DNA-binding transcriptional MerR regulator [Corticibacter populi]